MQAGRTQRFDVGHDLPDSKVNSDMALSAPLISVYIPTRNRSADLLAAVSSVLTQTYRPLEVVVVDDCSEDDTEELMRTLTMQHTSLKYIRSDQPRGAPAARNVAIEASSGQYVTGLDDDDLLEPFHLATLMDYWHLLESAGEHPAFIYTQTAFKRANTKVMSKRLGSIAADDLFDSNHVGNQIFSTRDNFIRAGLFDTSMMAWQDLEFFYRMLKNQGDAKLLDIHSYVFDDTPRPDRISKQRKEIIRNACAAMYSKHGNGERRKWQRLLLQVHSSYYGFSIGISDLFFFASLGIWPLGYVKLLHLTVRRLLGIG